MTCRLIEVSNFFDILAVSFFSQVSQAAEQSKRPRSTLTQSAPLRKEMLRIGAHRRLPSSCSFQEFNLQRIGISLVNSHRITTDRRCAKSAWPLCSRTSASAAPSTSSTKQKSSPMPARWTKYKFFFVFCSIGHHFFEK